MKITVTRIGAKTDAILRALYSLKFDALPGKKFGPFDFREARSQLEFAGDLSPAEARNLILEAYDKGTATHERA